MLQASNGGLVIEEASADAVATALRQAVLLGEQRLDQFGREGRAWILRECGWPKIARETLQVYSAHTAQHQAPPRLPRFRTREGRHRNSQALV